MRKEKRVRCKRNKEPKREDHKKREKEKRKEEKNRKEKKGKVKEAMELQVPNRIQNIQNLLGPHKQTPILSSRHIRHRRRPTPHPLLPLNTQPVALAFRAFIIITIIIIIIIMMVVVVMASLAREARR